MKLAAGISHIRNGFTSITSSFCPVVDKEHCGYFIYHLPPIVLKNFNPRREVVLRSTKRHDYSARLAMRYAFVKTLGRQPLQRLFLHPLPELRRLDFIFKELERNVLRHYRFPLSFVSADLTAD